MIGFFETSLGTHLMRGCLWMSSFLSRSFAAWSRWTSPNVISSICPMLCVSPFMLITLLLLLESLVSLTELNLSGNHFASISNVLASCLHLKRLILRNCGLESLPSPISDIPHLEHLDISNNPIASADGLRSDTPLSL